jgi:hypothetical protein
MSIGNFRKPDSCDKDSAKACDEMQKTNAEAAEVKSEDAEIR